MRQSLLAALLATAMIPAAPAALAQGGAPTADAAHNGLAKVVADPRRSEVNRARDKYRHPTETLTFFGVTPEQTIVEFIPGRGWYTEILAPLVKEKGRYVALVPATPKAREGAAKLLADKKEAVGANASVATIDFATGATTAAPGSADTVLTFRNVHNLMMNGESAGTNVFAAFFKILKPGGVLGVVDHRLPEDRDVALEKSSGYIKRSTIVRLAEGAGFKLVGESQVNANPKDKADYPDGVWTLPPTLQKGDVDRDRYVAIGESDRVTLKFVKPKG